MRRGENIKQRARFCQRAIKDPKLAAEDLRGLALGLENCRKTTDVIEALCTIFAVSERTIFNDLLKDLRN